MDSHFFIRTPFVIKATEITEDNIDEIAELIGRVRRPEDAPPYIAVDWRRVPNIKRADIGWMVTSYNGNHRCYAPKVFAEQFTEYKGEVTFSLPLPAED